MALSTVIAVTLSTPPLMAEPLCTERPGAARLLAYSAPSGSAPVADPVDRNDPTVDGVIAHILEHAGLTRNFVTRPAPIANAMATMDDRGHRLIVYNPAFVREIASYGSPKWAKISVFLHEIGHHLLGHIFEYDENFKQRELEADEFSGFLIYRMGATIEEAQLVASEYAQDWETPTHPGREERLEAIARGWYKAQRIATHESQMAKARYERTGEK